MTDKEKEAINQVDWIRINFFDKKYGETFTENEYSDYYEALCEVLNLVQSQQEEIKTQRDIIVRHIKKKVKLEEEIEKKDKIIDEMANHIVTSDSNLCQYLDMTTKCKYYAGENKKTCDKCIKEYFLNKVEKEKQNE